MSRDSTGLYLRETYFRKPPPVWSTRLILLVIVGSPLALGMLLLLGAR